MNKEIIKSERLGEEYIKIKHSSGLTLLLYPMKDFASTYALFATKYGSVDNTFRRSGEKDFTTVPEGIAHFLEHKMFDCKDGDAFSKYAKTGASANAYTSHDKTAYLFSCTDNFEASLRILLSFVTEPYFTQPSVDKEQGIIGQEIRMYDDDPDWQVFFNLLKAMYRQNPLRIDIAGTVESIAKIDAKLLNYCYDCFYNLNNMVLSIAGNFDVETVVKLCDEILVKAPSITIERAEIDEPVGVAQPRIEVEMPVAMPMFQIGYKGMSGTESENIYNQLLDNLITDIVAGESSPLYRRMYDAGLINSTFGGECLYGRDHISIIFSGESRNPDEVMQQINSEILALQKNGIDNESFIMSKKSMYGGHVSAFSMARSTATMMMDAYFSGVNAYNLLEKISEITKEQVQERLMQTVNINNSAISIVKPQN